MNWLDLSLDDGRDWDHHRSDPSSAPGTLGERWQRSQLLGAEPSGPAVEPVETETRIRVRRERIDPVMQVVNRVLSPMLELFNARDFTVLFADQDGVVVQQHAGGQFAPTAREVRLMVGSVWDEPTRGTNAIGTALLEERPTSVLGPAHFCRANAGIVCYAVPIHDAWGRVVGVVDATSHISRANPLAGAALLAAGRAIQETLEHEAISRPRGAFLQRLLGRLHEPGLLVSPTGRILHANPAAISTFPSLHPRQAPSGRTINAVLGVNVVELAAAASGQIRLPGLEVEAIERSDGRSVGWMVLVPPRRPSITASPSTEGSSFRGLVGSDATLTAVRIQAAQLAPSTLPVLITGESGTGKENLARGIHEASQRHSAPFVAVNCAALTPSLVHSELFGHAPNAFTGAHPEGKKGHIAHADGGTLFLDEIGDMPTEVQALLLRFLEDGSYRRVGETLARTARVRLICATSVDLAHAIQADRFRHDLLYRIRGAHLVLPPLRERTDLDELARHLLRQVATDEGIHTVPNLAPSTLARLEAHTWPGNVRELRMALHHALVVSAGEAHIEPWHLPLEAGSPAPGSAAAPPSLADRASTLAEARYRTLTQALAAANGNVSQAARTLGIARSTLYRMLKRGQADDASE